MQTPVLYVNADRNGYDLFHSRIAAHVTDQDAMERFFLAPVFEDLPAPIEIEDIRQWVQDVREATGCADVWVIIDTIRNAFLAGKDAGAENDSTAMVGVLGPARQLAVQENVAVTCVHHNSRATDEYAGSSAIAGLVDTFIKVNRKEEDTTADVKISTLRGHYNELRVTRQTDGTLVAVKQSKTEDKDAQVVNVALAFGIGATIKEAMDRFNSTRDKKMLEDTFERRVADAFEEGMLGRMDDLKTAGRPAKRYRHLSVKGK
jgi:hypothetical protein